MGVYYYLVNQSKKEIISFCHIPAWKKRELAGNPISAAIVTWYMLENIGDTISFIGDTDDRWPFKNGSVIDLREYSEVTDKIVDGLIKASIIKDEGRLVIDDDEPEFYERILKNVWFDN
jgi:hypothetical protein